jgi:hypothetical protein
MWQYIACTNMPLTKELMVLSFRWMLAEYVSAHHPESPADTNCYKAGAIYKHCKESLLIFK